MTEETELYYIGSYPNDVTVEDFAKLRNYIAETSDFVDACDEIEYDRLYLDGYNVQDRKGIFVLLKSTNDLVGFCFIVKSKTEPDNVYITNLAVSPDHRNKGIATRLIHESEAYSRKESLNFTRLYVETTNLSATKAL